MNEPTTGITHALLGKDSATFMRILALSIQGIIAVGVFWIGATFERKSDFEVYRREQAAIRMEELKSISAMSETMARLDERIKAQFGEKR